MIEQTQEKIEIFSDYRIWGPATRRGSSVTIRHYQSKKRVTGKISDWLDLDLKPCPKLEASYMRFERDLANNVPSDFPLEFIVELSTGDF